jgi:hypothetical protein
MQKFRLIQWCDAATGLIRFGPDRKKVNDELLGHLEDRRDALMQQGMDEREATEKALEAMGDAKEIAPQLAAVHRTLWGYLLWGSKIAVIALLCLCLATAGKYAKSLKLKETPTLRDFDIYSTESYGGDTGRTLLHLSHPDLSFTSDGNRFVITDAALITHPRPDGSLFPPALYIRMRQTSILPWQEQKEFFQYFSVSAYFYAQDSLGNEYPAFFSPPSTHGSRLNTTGVQSGIFTYTHELWINNFPPEAEWVDICYEREGRFFCMRVYLDGGEAS